MRRRVPYNIIYLVASLTYIIIRAEGYTAAVYAPTRRYYTAAVHVWKY